MPRKISSWPPENPRAHNSITFIYNSRITNISKENKGQKKKKKKSIVIMRGKTPHSGYTLRNKTV